MCGIAGYFGDISGSAGESILRAMGSDGHAGWMK
jgi:hypothetical protein